MTRNAIRLAMVRLCPSDPRTPSFFFARRAPRALVQPGYIGFLHGPLEHDDAPELQSVPAPVVAGAMARAQTQAAYRIAFAATGWLPHASLPGGGASAPALREQWLAERWPFSAVLEKFALRAAELVPPLSLGTAITPPFGGPAFCTEFLLLSASDAPPAFAQLHGVSDGEWLTPAEATRRFLQGWPLAPVEAALMQALQAMPAVAGEVGHVDRADDNGWAKFAATAQTACVGILTAGGSAPRQRAWQQSPNVELLPVRSPTLAPATHTNCYLLGNQDLVVVDPGTPYPADQGELLQWIQARVAAGGRLREIWITHHHADHIGAAKLVRERFGARVRAHPLCAEALREVVPIDRPIHDDEVLPVGLDGYRALFTPGHAVGHLCFYDLERHHLFSGDNVLGLGTSIVVPAPHGNMRQYMHSLRRVAALPLSMLFPGHGPPGAQSAVRVRETLRQRELREQQVRSMVPTGGGAVAFDHILATLYRGLPASTQRLAALSLRAHVDKLVEDGLLRLTSEASSDGASQRLMCRAD